MNAHAAAPAVLTSGLALAFSLACLSGCGTASAANGAKAGTGASTVALSALSTSSSSSSPSASSASPSASEDADGHVASGAARASLRGSASSSADSNVYDAISASVVPGCAASGASDVTYRDGTYYASGEGKNGPVDVTVVVTDGMVTRISLGQNAESPAMLEKAQSTVVPEILASQSTADVQTAAGATITSDAIVSAVADALARAVA